MTTEILKARTDFYRRELRDSLQHVFGDIDADVAEAFLPKLVWIEISGGETLFKQGDPGDALYFVLSGRMAAYREDEEGNPQLLGEISRGEVVGEMAIYTDDVRSADVVALRDSLLVKLPQQVYEDIVQEHPEITIKVTRSIVERLKQSQSKKPVAKPVNICFVPIHQQHSISGLMRSLAKALQKFGGVAQLNSGRVDAHFSREGIAQVRKEATEDYYRLVRWLNEVEYEHDYVLYECDAEPSEWSQRCLRQADLIIYVADATQPPQVSEMEQCCQAQSGIVQNLLLVHPADTPLPSNTGAWLQERPAIDGHFHIRQGDGAHLARLARILTRNAVGLVLAGGAAKGFAHLGVYKALREEGIVVDYLGGTSVGGMMAALIALDTSMDDLIKHTRNGALHNPTKDFNLFPLMSLVRGRRMANMIKDTLYDFTHRYDLDLADTWLPTFLVTSNYSKAKEELHTKGDLRKLLQATSAIPGVFPPVIMGNDFLVDGGTFNNFPTDVMSNMGVSKIIGVDFFSKKNYKLDISETPDAYELAMDRLRPKRKRKFRLPSIISILLNATLLYSYARRKESLAYLDLHFNPQVAKYGFTNWAAFDKIFEEGYQHAKERLAASQNGKVASLKQAVAAHA
ncbi:MAG: cyclic nucleotide-binding domain-containing protein [Bacteroidetes bacterium]|jgi:NTE family protein|nr:cyclic nucleotide-binding domain-containing protein [Bacteroidota bacterium]